jgi:steroid delta-isomerase-like uncharacterized protein
MTMDSKALVREFVEEAQDRGNVEAVDEYLAEDFVDHSAFPGTSPNREGVKRVFAAFHEAFDDFRVVIHDQVADGGKVVTRKTLHGTHRGEFMGVPPTDREVSIHVTDVLYVKNGRITDHWTAVDRLDFMRQLGVVPE